MGRRDYGGYKFADRILLISITLDTIFSCSPDNESADLPWERHGELSAGEGSRIIRYEDGTPFLWLGCTAWGMTEWLSREDAVLILE
jgi:hypothetical protein